MARFPNLPCRPRGSKPGFRLLRLLPALLLLLLPAAAAAFAGEPSAPLRLTVLHTNDMHGYVAPRAMGKDKEIRGGIARIAGAAAKVRREVEAKGGFSVLVDGGDFYAGTPEGNMTRGRLVVEMMNVARFDLACVGNHEFDDGPENLSFLAGIAKFPFLAANLREKANGARPSWVREFVILDFGGVKGAFAGVLTTETAIISSGATAYEFEDETEALRRAAANARKEGALFCVALTHMGFDRDQEVSDRFPADVALVVGAHSHTPLKRGWRNPRTGLLVVQTGCYALQLGRVDLEIDRATGKVLSAEARLVPLTGEDAPEAQDVKAALDKGAAGIRREMDVVLGESVHEVERSGGRFSGASSPLGNWIADLIREAGNAEIGFQNRGGVRDVLPAGPVTMRDLFEICPFGNTVVAMDLMGKDLLALWETSLREGDRFLLEVSGMEVEYDPDREAGSRVLRVRVGGKPLDPAASYRVATNSFLADGGDGHPAFPRGTNRKDTGVYLRELLSRAVREKSPLKVEYRNRIKKRTDKEK